MEPLLTVRETLEMYAGYYERPRSVDETIELVGLADKADARAGGLSGGQQRRLDVAVALIGDAELLFLDEPTTGFDPSARRQAWSVIEGLRDLGKTVLLTTHYMDEAQALADRVAVIADGRIIAAGTPDDLGGRSTADDADQLRHPRLRGCGGARAGDRRRLVPGQRQRGAADRRADAAPERDHLLGARPRDRARQPRGSPSEPRGRLPRADRPRERSVTR